MKGMLVLLLILFSICIVQGETFTPNTQMIFTLPDSIRIEKLSEELVSEKDILSVSKRYKVLYDGKELSMQVRFILSKENSDLLEKLVKQGLVHKKEIGNIELFNSYYKPTLVVGGKSNTVIYKYIYDVGNEWSSDLLGYSIVLNSFYLKMNFTINNIYSILVNEGGYISPWNQDTVINFKDKENSGIVFYKLLDEIVKSVNVINTDVFLHGIVNDTRVRMRKGADLSSATVKLLDTNTIVYILDTSQEKIEIEGKQYPWLRVKTISGDFGWICSRYLTINLP